MDKTEEINALLYEKMQAEYTEFLNGLKELPADKAIEKAYEKVIKEDLVACVESGDLEPKQAKALYGKKYPLDYCYQEWLRNDYSHMDMLRDTIGDASQKAVREMKSKSRESR